MKRAWFVVAALFLGCQPTGPVEVPARVVGEELCHSTELSASQFNTFTCATCHSTDPHDDSRMLSGYTLAGVTRRPRTWGGNERDLLGAVNFCLQYFMRGEPMPRDDARGKALYEYLASLDGPQETLPFTVVKTIVDVPRGDPERGRVVYDRACLECHGALHTGEGRNTEYASILPEVAEEYDELFPGIPHGLVFIEKVRHGQFYGVGGNMPLFSLEALSDDDLGALLAYLGM